MVTIAALLWAIAGVIGGHLLSYPGDGLNMRHFFGMMLGPIALGLALWEIAFSD